MSLERINDQLLEDRLNAVLLAFIEARESGQEPDRHTLLAENPELRDELEAFLAGHDDVARLTDPLRSARMHETQVPEHSRMQEPRIPTTGIGEIGDFRLLREVGRGGMGIVYEAEQISLRRRVALKILPFAAAIDSRRLQRFKTEALTAAHVQHEKIVPVHAVGCERGVHYYAMQFIDGQSLASLISELRRIRDEPAASPPSVDGGGKRKPATDEGSNDALTSDSNADVSLATTTISEERSSDRRRYYERAAGLSRQAALALEHAHQAGIVHRDVKPGNLLLDLRGQLWVTDFGLAQVTGEAGLTISGELLGTLRYASPEQVLARRGIVDHRSDVYSLGATLYELVTLRPPFESRDRNTLIRQITEEDPPAPCSLDRSIPTELETIILKALRKEPVDRYGTAQELADDLRRFLDGTPILAQPPTPTERIRAWSRRHPSLVGAGILALILISAVSWLSTALVRREQAKTLVEQKKAEAAFYRERQHAEEAEARFRLARRAVDELIRASEEELAHRPGMEGLRKRLLTSALVYYREFVEQRRSDPGAQAELLDNTRRVETILADLGVLRAAGELYLLAQPAALDDLKLDKSQRERVTKLSERAGKRWMESFGDPADLPPATERLRIALEIARANEVELDAVLLPGQRSRLRQLALQAEGPAAFREPEVVEALSLSLPQREQIRTIEERYLRSQMRELQAGKAIDEDGQPAMERIVELLSADQASRWRSLIGEPVRGPLSMFPAPFRPRRDPKRAAN